MATLGNGQILENGMKLIPGTVTVEDPLAKKIKTDEAENICKSLFKDQAIIAGCVDWFYLKFPFLEPLI